jgi:hypothetical protein
MMGKTEVVRWLGVAFRAHSFPLDWILVGIDKYNKKW